MQVSARCADLRIRSPNGALPPRFCKHIVWQSRDALVALRHTLPPRTALNASDADAGTRTRRSTCTTRTWTRFQLGGTSENIHEETIFVRFPMHIGLREFASSIW